MATAGSKRALEEAPQQLQTTANEAAVCCRCSKSDVKYRCPRCERITCSLQCCVGHKKQAKAALQVFDCNGKRDRTKFVGIKKFTDADLSSDFFFLEEVSRSTNSAARSRSQLNANAKRFTANKKRKGVKDKQHTAAGLSGAINPDIPADWLARFPIAVQLFAEHAAKRGVALTLLAPGMSKRARNSSYMDKKKNTLYWRVEWAFPSAEVPVSHSEERVDEKRTLFALLGKYLTPSQENVAIRGKLKQYAVSGWEKHLVLLLRKEFTPASQPQYYRLDGNQSLESNLKRKAVVEFPVITVALAADADQYPVAHDVIEAISTTETKDEGPLPSTEEPEAMEVEESSSELLTGAAEATASATGKLFSISEEEAEDVEAPTQLKRVLIEELPVAAR